MFTAATATIVAVLAGVLSCIVSLCKLAGVDRKRQKARGTHQFTRSLEGGDQIAGVASREAPVFSATSREKVARLADILPQMHTGDLFLFSGRKWHSYLIRIASWSPISHVGMIFKDHTGAIFVAEVVERMKFGNWKIDKGGFQLVPIEKYVNAYPGQAYYAPVAPEYDRPVMFNRGRAALAIGRAMNWQYGWFGILYQLTTKLPFIRIATYLLTWRKLDEPWESKPPFCSWAVNLWAQSAGQDPTPCLAPQLTSPAEIERSKLWGEKTALVP